MLIHQNCFQFISYKVDKIQTPKCNANELHSPFEEGQRLHGALFDSTTKVTNSKA